MESEVRKIGFTPKVKAKLSQMRKRLDQIQSDAKDYSKKKERLDELPDQRALIREMSIQFSDLKRTLEKLTKQEQELREHESKYSALTDRLAKMRTEITEAVKRAAEASGASRTLSVQVKEIEKLRPEITKLRKTANALLAKQTLYTLLKEEIFHRKGVLIFAINQLLQSIG